MSGLHNQHASVYWKKKMEKRRNDKNNLQAATNMFTSYLDKIVSNVTTINELKTAANESHSEYIKAIDSESKKGESE